MSIIINLQVIILSLLIKNSITDQHEDRVRRQIVDRPGGNPGVPMNNNNPQFIPPNVPSTNQRQNPKVPMANEQFVGPSNQPTDPNRSRGYYNSPLFQPPPFTGEKPTGWFGTNHFNWISNRESELDKNKLANAKISPTENSMGYPVPPRRENSGPELLAKIAQQYAAKGDKAFKYGPHETLQGKGSVCYNHENFQGFVFGRFSCPLPASTGMNQQDQYCCGLANYQYCCNAQEFSFSQRGAFSENSFLGNQRYPKYAKYSSSTKKILAIVLPIVSFIVLAGIGILVFLYYKKFRRQQFQTVKTSGAIRLKDSYTAIPQEIPTEKVLAEQNNKQIKMINSQA